MKNLFVCHTQANLILASSLALGRFKDDENLLILFVDFGLKDELKDRLDKTFAHTLYLQSIYPQSRLTEPLPFAIGCCLSRKRSRGAINSTKQQKWLGWRMEYLHIIAIQTSIRAWTDMAGPWLFVGSFSAIF